MSVDYEYIKAYKKEHYVPVYMSVFPEEKESWRAAAKAAGSSLQGFIRETVNRRVREGKKW